MAFPQTVYFYAPYKLKLFILIVVVYFALYLHYIFLPLFALPGYAAYELSKGLSQLAKKQLSSAGDGKTQQPPPTTSYTALMAEALHHLEKANEIMAFEAKDTFYGELALAASNELKEMQKTFKELN